MTAKDEGIRKFIDTVNSGKFLTGSNESEPIPVRSVSGNIFLSLPPCQFCGADGSEMHIGGESTVLLYCSVCGRETGVIIYDPKK